MSADDKAGDKAMDETASGKAKAWTTATGLQVEEIESGEGAEAKKGKTLVVYYSARDKKGSRIHSSHQLGHPFSFELGAGQVIPGWEEGLKGMRPGARRRLTVPPHLGYGSKTAANADGSIQVPADTTMVYEIKLIEVK